MSNLILIVTAANCTELIRKKKNRIWNLVMAFNGQVSVSIILQSVFIQLLVHKVLFDLQNNPRQMFLCMFLQLWRAKILNLILSNLSIKPQYL